MISYKYQCIAAPLAETAIERQHGEVSIVYLCCPATVVPREILFLKNDREFAGCVEPVWSQQFNGVSQRGIAGVDADVRTVVVGVHKETDGVRHEFGRGKSNGSFVGKISNGRIRGCDGH